MSDYDFDLHATPPPSPEPRVFTVSEVTRGLREVIEETFPAVWVQGEISNYRLQSSGHQYFTLKDSGAQLACVMFARGGVWRKTTQLADGMLVQARGKLTVYEARGQYQLNVSVVQAAGAGLLQAKFEALKRKLDAEGLFDESRKRPLPPFPRTIAIVTSPTGAALRDMLQILARRAPWLRVIVSPVRVQGDGAAEEMIAAVEELNRHSGGALPQIDIIVLARGGGSAEDLWEFNDEALARVIAASEIPTVSGVGHEIDFTISDFVADLRAPTPSAAAELIVPDTAALLRGLEESAQRLQRLVTARLELWQSEATRMAEHSLFREPRVRLEQAAQQLDLAEQALREPVRARVAELRQVLSAAEMGFLSRQPHQQIALLRQPVELAEERLRARLELGLKECRERFSRSAEVLRLLSPEATLARGYSVTTTADGKFLHSATDAVEGIAILTRMHDGTITSTVGAATSPPPKHARAAAKKIRRQENPPAD